MATTEGAPAVATAADEKPVDVKVSENADAEKSGESKEQVKESNGSTAKDPSGAEQDDFERYDDKSDKRDRRDRGNRNRGRDDRRDNKRGGARRGGKFNGAGRGGSRADRKNVKTRYDNRPESDDADAIRRQVEFYFSDSNLPIDKFLLAEVQGVENKPIPLKVIHSFSRMRNFQPFSAVVEAVKQSEHLAVNDKDEVHRKTPIDASFTLDVKENEKLLTSDSMKRSIYAKGFGEEGEKTAFDIEEFFEPYGVKGVRLRRDDTRSFKGSVFVEFIDEASATNFLQLDPKPKFKGEELLVKSKKAYVDEKMEGIKDGSVRPRSPNRGFNEHRGGKHQQHSRRNQFRDRKRRRGDDDRDGGRDDDDDVEDKDDWRARRDRDQGKRRKGDDGESKEGGDDDNAHKHEPVEAAEATKEGAGEEKKSEVKSEEKPKEPEQAETATASAAA